MENVVRDFRLRGDDGAVHRLPVIFHILSSEGQAAPDEGQVRYQLDVLNQCFGSYKPGGRNYTNEALELFEPMGVNPQVQFYIPDSYEGASGIRFVKTDRKVFGLNHEMQHPATGGVAPVTPEKAINIWVGALGDSNAGYASFPGAPAEWDGIVIDPGYFGNAQGTARAPYQQGKTLVHLMGTYLGLYELWNETNACADDYVADTPPHGGPTVTAGKNTNYRVMTICQGYVLAMYMNFMDNTDDEYLSLFTQGQKTRMRAVLAEGGPRHGLAH